MIFKEQLNSLTKNMNKNPVITQKRDEILSKAALFPQAPIGAYS